ncbi:MAG: O-antigen ligase family protein [Gammaproteobacteria bacterium]|nr:MAG: O-antigen ligase family protein [Gammaproteobacteria bacterium]
MISALWNKAWWRANYSWLLVLSFLPLLATGGFELATGVMALIGLMRLMRAPRAVLGDPGVRLMLALFACLWLPMVLSLPDAVNFNRALGTTASFLRFPLAGIFIIQTLCATQAFERLWLGLVWVIGFFCADALFQLIAGFDLFGRPYDGIRLNGVFSKLALGTVLAVTAPVYFEGLRRFYGQYRHVWLAAAPLPMVVFFSASRAAWIMLALSLGIYLFYLWRLNPRARRPYFALRAALMVAAAVGVTALLALQQPSFLARLAQTLQGSSGDYEDMNVASAGRLPIWRTALSVAQAHWINGVGPRGFRYVYTEHAAPDDPLRLSGATHPHLLLLEIASETGLIGVAGLVLFFTLALRAIRRLPSTQRQGLFPWALVVLVALAPWNTHLALYGNYWSSFVWWTLLLALAVWANAARPSRTTV